MERPHAAPTIIVGLLAALYLLVGAVTMWAYTSTLATDGYHVRWSKLPFTVPYLVPGTLLAVATAFLRHHKWAVITASSLVLAAIPLILPRLVWYVILFPRFPYRLWSYILVVIHAAALALLVAALGLLWRQWRTLRTRPLAAGAGFEVSIPLVILMMPLALVLSGCANSPTPQMPQPGSEMSGRWRIIQAEYMSRERDEKSPILLDTQTGETWHQIWDTNRGLKWQKLTQDR